MNIYVRAIIICLTINGCTEKELTTDEVFVLQQKNLYQTIGTAKNGDIKSIRTLIAHYDAIKDGDNQAKFWRTKALTLGDPEELYIHANKIAHKAMRERDSLIRHQLLINALESAELSHASRSDAHTLKLIKEIKVQISKETQQDLE